MKRKILSVSIMAPLMAVLLLSCNPDAGGDDDGGGGDKNPIPGDSGVYATITLGPVSGSKQAGVYVWITDTNDSLIRVLDYYTKGANGKLYVWSQDTPTNFKAQTNSNIDTDAITRATQNVSSAAKEYISKTWDTPSQNTTYRIHVEIVSYQRLYDYYTADIEIDGTAKTVDLTKVSGSDIMKSGTVTYNP